MTALLSHYDCIFDTQSIHWFHLQELQPDWQDWEEHDDDDVDDILVVLPGCSAMGAAEETVRFSLDSVSAFQSRAEKAIVICWHTFMMHLVQCAETYWRLLCSWQWSAIELLINLLHVCRMLLTLPWQDRVFTRAVPGQLR